eukprot:CAMPEP_0119009228 /NCGR_PEP_ID=MMETSP1176-20130426/4224_1 /TAXON_ID=265551 /ORGANISM="Synedropsis recta cf, Strain CCMP1620" /LENGTH=445 /DNA_ID=CAMNT_0006961697 /DNA_START=112 /DNA_END=1449 /DNA_ORIENTATION=-
MNGMILEPTAFEESLLKQTNVEQIIMIQQHEQQEELNEQSSFLLKRTTTSMNTSSTTCLSDLGGGIHDHYINSNNNDDDHLSTNEVNGSSSSSPNNKNNDPKQHPLHQAFESVGNKVQHWKRQQEEKQRQENVHLRKQASRLIQEAAQSLPEGKLLLRRQQLHELGPMGVALFSPIEGGLLMAAAAESRDETNENSSSDFGVSRMKQEEDHCSAGNKCQELDSKDAVSARTENSTPADDFSDDDEVYLHVIPDDDTVPRLLSESVMKELLVQAMPHTLHGRWWKRLFSITRDGDSFDTFLNNVKGYEHSLIVVQTTRGDVLGGFADAAWDQGCRTTDKEGRFFGMGTSFLFSLVPSSSSETDDSPIQVFKWTGANMYNQLCRKQDGGVVGMGGGGGSFGLVLQQEFTKGSSGACETYGNASSLTMHSDGCFDILNFEVYGFERYW